MTFGTFIILLLTAVCIAAVVVLWKKVDCELKAVRANISSLNRLIDEYKDTINGIITYNETKFSNINDKVNDLISNVDVRFSDVGETIGGIATNFNTNISEIKKSIADIDIVVSSALVDINKKVSK